MKNNKLYFIILATIICLLLTSCVMMNTGREYKIGVTFENNDDISAFEQRLEAFKINIKSYEKSGNNVSYSLKTLWAEEDVFELLTQNYDLQIIDKNREPLFGTDDIISLEYYAEFLRITVTEEYEKDFTERESTRMIYFIVDGEEYVVDAAPKDSVITFGYGYAPESDPICLKKATVALASDKLKGSVTINSIDY